MPRGSVDMNFLFTLGEVQINGLPDPLRAEVAALFKIPGGAPYNQPYFDDYVREAVKYLGNRIRSLSQEMRVRPGTRVIDESDCVSSGAHDPAIQELDAADRRRKYAKLLN